MEEDVGREPEVLGLRVHRQVEKSFASETIGRPGGADQGDRHLVGDVLQRLAVYLGRDDVVVVRGLMPSTLL